MVNDKPITNTPAVELACAWLDEVKELLRAKNRAYGDSVAKPIGIFSKLTPIEGIRIRIDDKLKRIAMGNRGGDEDTVKDLVGYLAFLVTIEGKT